MRAGAAFLMRLWLDLLDQQKEKPCSCIRIEIREIYEKGKYGPKKI